MRTPNNPLRAPKLVLSFLCWQKMMALVRAAPGEIMGYLRVTEGDDGNYYAGDNDIFVVHQHTTVGSVAETNGGRGELDCRMMLEEPDDEREFLVQWHSHPTQVGPYFSEHYDEMGKLMNKFCDMFTVDNAFTDEQFMMFMVVDETGRLVARFDQYHPRRLGLPMEVIILPMTDFDDWARVQIDTYVTFEEPDDESGEIIFEGEKI